MYRKSPNLPLAAALFCPFVLSCNPSDAGPQPKHAEIEKRGDTTFVSSPADLKPPTDTARIEITFRSNDLEQPSGVARIGSRLVVGDKVRIHVLTAEGKHIATSGSSGEGPGEFGHIMALGTRGDTALVLDDRLQRLSFHDSTGAYMRSIALVPVLPFVNPRRGAGRLQTHEDGILYQATESIRVGRPTQAAIVWRSLARDSSETVRAWDDIEWKEVGRSMLVRTRLFGPHAYIALGSDNLYAHGDGVDYCFTLEVVDATEVTRVCRDWQRVPVTPVVRSPDLTDLDARGFDGFAREIFEIGLEETDIGELWPSYDRLVLDELNRTWVRRIGSEQATTHPYLWYYLSDLRPYFFAWDVFSLDGELLLTVLFPGAFEPLLIESQQAFGSWELPSGEFTIAKATW